MASLKVRGVTLSVSREKKEEPLDFLFINSKKIKGINFPIGRDPRDIEKGCDMRGCNRPSAFSIITTAELDVDIPGITPSRLKGQDRLPTYKWHNICDRHYRDGVHKDGYTPSVIGPTELYKVKD